MTITTTSPTATPSGLHNPRYPDHITTPGQNTRNVIDHYKPWTDDDIRTDLAMTAHPLVVVLENFAHDFNIGTGVRNANGFGASKVVILGRGQWDRRGSVGTHHYTPVERTRDAHALFSGYKEQGYQIIAVDNIDGSIPVRQHTWQPKTVLVFGQEDIGVSNLTLDHADACVMIPMRGSVRSFNVGTASGIVMNAYAEAMDARSL